MVARVLESRTNQRLQEHSMVIWLLNACDDTLESHRNFTLVAFQSVLAAYHAHSLEIIALSQYSFTHSSTSYSSTSYSLATWFATDDHCRYHHCPSYCS